MQSGRRLAEEESVGRLMSWGALEVPDFGPREVRVFVPGGDIPVRQRPVLYLFDGQNVFGDEGSFAGGWWAHTAVERLRRYRGVSPPIVVGIANGGVLRMDELSPWPLPGGGGGRADAFLDWLVETLVPRVQGELGIGKGPVHAVVGGSSLGGLAALYAHYRHPTVFGGALCMSPSLFAGGGALFREVARRPRPMFSRIYLDCGLREGRGQMAKQAESMASSLVAKGYPPEQLRWRLDRRGSHNERSWRRRLPGALRFMFRQGR